jgi:hypothetical protein
VGKTQTTQRTIAQSRTQTEERNVDNDVNQLNEARELRALRLANRAARSISQLELHRKELAREYAERIKRLRKIIQAIQQRDQMGLLPMEGLDQVIIGEDDLSLVHDPIAGL